MGRECQTKKRTESNKKSRWEDSEKKKRKEVKSQVVIKDLEVDDKVMVMSSRKRRVAKMEWTRAIFIALQERCRMEGIKCAKMPTLRLELAQKL